MITWSIRRFAVTAIPSETRWQVVLEELRQNECLELCSRDLANSVQNLWHVLCHDSTVCYRAAGTQQEQTALSLNRKGFPAGCDMKQPREGLAPKLMEISRPAGQENKPKGRSVTGWLLQMWRGVIICNPASPCPRFLLVLGESHLFPQSSCAWHLKPVGVSPAPWARRSLG